ncbi:hypothetical protein Tco_0844834 [Tanacetum coccineum]
MTSSSKTNSPNFKRKTAIMSVKYPNYVNLTSSSREQPNERTLSPPPRKKSLSPPQAPSKSISSKRTHYTSSSSPSESPTPTYVAPSPKLRFVIPIKFEHQELPPRQLHPRIHQKHWTDPGGIMNSLFLRLYILNGDQSHDKRRIKRFVITSSRRAYRNLKVHEVVMEKDSEIYRGKKERVKSIALQAKKDSSDDETSTSRSDDEEYSMVIPVSKPSSLAIVQNHLATKIKRPSLEVLGAIAKIDRQKS